MNPNVNVDIPKSQKKQTKAIVYRFHQGLKKELRSIDQEFLKTLSSIDRDLEKTKESLKALRMENSRLKVDRFGSKQTVYCAPRMVPKPPLRRRSLSIPFETVDTLERVLKRRRCQVLARGVGKKLEARDSSTSMKTDEVSESSKQEVSTCDLMPSSRKSEVDKKTFTLHGTVETDGHLVTTIEDGLGARVDKEQGVPEARFDLVQGSLETRTAKSEEDLDMRIPDIQGDLGTKVEERLGDLGIRVHNEIERHLGTRVDTVRGDLEITMTDYQPKEPGKEGDLQLFAKRVFRNSWINHEDCPKDSKSDISTFNLPRKRMLARRSSTPDLVLSSHAEPEVNKPTLGLSRLSSTSITELSQGNACTFEITNDLPSEKPVARNRTARRSSIAVMTGVSASSVPSYPGTPSRKQRSLPELSEIVDKYSLQKRISPEDNHMKESLLKIGRRLGAPLTGAQLQKRLQAHRFGGAALQTRLTCMPESKHPAKKDNDFNMSELENCRYLRRRLSK